MSAPPLRLTGLTNVIPAINRVQSKHLDPLARGARIVIEGSHTNRSERIIASLYRGEVARRIGLISCGLSGGSQKGKADNVTWILGSDGIFLNTTSRYDEGYSIPCFDGCLIDDGDVE